MFRSFTLLFFLLLGLGLEGQTNTISGYVKDAATGETMIGATVYSFTNQKGTSTNEYGFYTLQVPAGEVKMMFSYIGYQNIDTTVTINEDLTFDVELSSGEFLEEVVVEANSYQEQVNSTQMSVDAITTKEAKLLPALFGEVDILKIVQLKPGISSGSEGSTGLYVRGGASDQNLIVLDEAVVYNASHLFGFFSTFNADAVKDVKVYKGGFPSQYGGRLSSVIDVKLNEGNKKKFSGTGGLGLISSRLTLEGPIVKDKGSFIVSGRRTYVDIFTRQINKANEQKAQDDPSFELPNPIPDYYFYDLNAKLNYEFGDKDKVFISGYFGRDVFGFNDDAFNFNFDWGNATGTARWNHLFKPNLFANTTFTFSDYKYNINNEVTGFSFNLGSNIRDANLKADFYYAPSNEHTIRFGLGATYHQFTVGRLRAGSDDGEVSFSAGSEYDGMEYGLYGGDEWIVNDKFTVNAGVRLSGFSNDGAFYGGVEPRASAKYSVSDKLSVKASYARMYQYVHLISNSGISLPTDVWYPSTKGVKPQISDQVALGWATAIGEKFFLSNEFYFKNLQNQIDFVDHAELFANDNLEEEFTFGRGYAYGGEIYLEKKKGDLTGWIGYTLAWIRRGDFPEVMDGAYFSPRYDRRHDLTTVLMYKLNKRFTFTSSFVYGTGDAAWLPSGRFSFQDISGSSFDPVVPVFGDRNTFRFPAYHRLDVGVVVKFFPKWGESDLTVSVYNAYDRRNPFFFTLDFETEENDLGIDVPTQFSATQVSLFPILPSVTYNFKF